MERWAVLFATMVKISATSPSGISSPGLVTEMRPVSESSIERAALAASSNIVSGRSTICSPFSGQIDADLEGDCSDHQNGCSTSALDWMETVGPPKAVFSSMWVRAKLQRTSLR